ncbi:MAG: hypothetical protein EBV28_02545 [Betaproteobacteria bacterium]|nr:hypothetical protein [Betaproteobacteria bacterium]
MKVVEVLDHQAGLAAVSQRHTAGLVDHGRSGLHGGFALLAEDAHDAALGADAVDLDRLVLRSGGASQREGGGRGQHGAQES